MRSISKICLIAKKYNDLALLQNIEWEKFNVEQEFLNEINRKIERKEKFLSIQNAWNCSEIQVKTLLMNIRNLIPDSILLGCTVSDGFKDISPYCIAFYSMPGDEIWGFIDYGTKECHIPKSMEQEEILNWFDNFNVKLSKNEKISLANFCGNTVLDEAIETNEDADLLNETLSYFFRLDDDMFETQINIKTQGLSRLFIVCDNESVFEHVLEFLKTNVPKELKEEIKFIEDEAWFIWGMTKGVDFGFSWIVDELIETFAEQIILVTDDFSFDWEDEDEVYKEGAVIAYFGDETQRMELSFYDKLSDSGNLNISDLKRFIEVYGISLTEKEKQYIDRKRLDRLGG